VECAAQFGSGPSPLGAILLARSSVLLQVPPSDGKCSDWQQGLSLWHLACKSKLRTPSCSISQRKTYQTSQLTIITIRTITIKGREPRLLASRRREGLPEIHGYGRTGRRRGGKKAKKKAGDGKGNEAMLWCVIGAGSIESGDCATVSAGKECLLADIAEVKTPTPAAQKCWADAGFDVRNAVVDVFFARLGSRARDDGVAMARITGVYMPPRVSPTQASPATILRWTLWHRASCSEEFGERHRTRRSGRVIASHRGHRLPARDAQRTEQGAGDHAR